MSTSTSSLFHYTKDLDTLKSILDNGLWPNYCDETFKTSKGQYVLGIPMVSFCDIPLSKTEDFRERYGSYGIALRKDWGIQKGINPILYVTNDNIFYSLSFYRTVAADLWNKAKEQGLVEGNYRVKLDLRDFNNKKEAFIDGCNSLHAQDHNNTIAGFLKPYATTKDDSSTLENYMENEWRYVVSDAEKTPWLPSKAEYDQWRGNTKDPKPEPPDAIKEKKLVFTVDDITHLIIKEEAELNDIISDLNARTHLCGQPLNGQDRAKLLSKIRCLDRIKVDF